MDYRQSYRDRSGAYDQPAGGAAYKHSIEDAYDRSRKRGRSPSPSFYAEDRRTSAYPEYPSAPDPWERPAPRDYRATSPYASRSAPYDGYRASDPYDERERDRALEWDRYYRERDHDYRNGYEYPDRERYEARMRYEDDPYADRDSRRRSRERERPYPPYDADYRSSATAASRDPYAHSAIEPTSVKSSDTLVTPDPMQSETLLPFRAYAQMIRAGHPSSRDRSIDQPSTQELYDGYQTYKTAFNKKAIVAFFEQRKDEAWFKEKYSSSEPFLEARLHRKRVVRAGKKDKWLQELADGKLDRINYDIQSTSGTDAGSDPRDRSNSNDGDGGDLALLSRYGELEILHGEQATIPACQHQILVKSFPADVPREKLEDLFRTKPGFRYLALGEPHVGKRWHRVGWAMYEQGTDMEDTLNALQGQEIDGFTLNLAPCSKPTSSKLRTVPEYANSFVRLLVDLGHCRQLVAKFEAEDRNVLFNEEAQTNAAASLSTWLETNASDAIMQRHKEIEPNLVEDDLERGYDPSEDTEKREQRRAWIKKQLDLHLDLLRIVYHCDYYISLVCEFEEELLRRSPRHGRKQPPPGQLVEEPRESTNDESWARSVDQKTVLLLAEERTDLTEQGGKSLDAEMMNAALPYIKEEEKEKHRCIVETAAGTQCGKLFKASIFVQKHVLNKHRGFLESIAGDAIAEAKFFNNYVRDPCRATGQPGPKELREMASGGGGSALAHRLDSGGQGGMFNGSRMGMIRFGGNVSAASDPTRRTGNNALSSAAPLGMRLGAMVSDPSAVKPEPLPPAPKPLDPRAAKQAPKSYQDLDGAAEGDVDLAY
ncbi:hypothetical protein BCV70DRAFT_201444 [Testicularia cyperi]|uniref:Uncharacterized protein n=1 Tax=Testicularia cyperi TaxID=1882483 RepID=A0A317XKR9_9BASI|nr:hypothetical protein BCV70DRAFT_201444 [Testicularia cyperi]